MSASERLNAALSGRYRIESELGEGGMATVYLARDVRHNRHVGKWNVPDFVPGAPTFLFALESVLTSTFDVHPDGRFLVAENVTQRTAGDGPAPRWLVVLDWFTTLEERLGR